MEKTPRPDTYFAPAGRATPEELRQEARILAGSELIGTLLNAMPDFLLILNSHRQIVTVNQRLLQAFHINHLKLVEGLRPGEAADCIHHHEGPDGCGTSRNCAVCGAVLTILASQTTGRPQHRKCSMLLSSSCNAFDIDIIATPITLEGKLFTILSLRDISAEKRRQAMERLFFHDVLNTVSGIHGMIGLLQDDHAGEEVDKYLPILSEQTNHLMEEISHQRRLMQAERGEYKLDTEAVSLPDLLYDLTLLYKNHKKAQGKALEVLHGHAGMINTDRALLRRVIGNMILNALEASLPGDSIQVMTDAHNNLIKIAITNPGEIPAEVQSNLFKRSFSTKNTEGRGLGTYSMKLFGERYLGGFVSFSSENNSTTFSIELPMEPAATSNASFPTTSKEYTT